MEVILFKGFIVPLFVVRYSEDMMIYMAAYMFVFLLRPAVAFFNS